MWPAASRANSPTARITSIPSTGRPTGREIAFISNREPNEDQFFNYDLAHAVARPPVKCRRLTATESAEYRPHWSPDGKTIVYEATKRGLTDLRDHDGGHPRLDDRRQGKNRRELGRQSTTARASLAGQAMAAGSISPCRSAAMCISIGCPRGGRQAGGCSERARKCWFAGPRTATSSPTRSRRQRTRRNSI